MSHEDWPFAHAHLIEPAEVAAAAAKKAAATDSPTVYPAPGTAPGFLTADEVAEFFRRCPAWAHVEVVGAHGKIQPASRLELVIGGDTATGPVIRIFALPAEDHDPVRGKATSHYERVAWQMLHS